MRILLYVGCLILTGSLATIGMQKFTNTEQHLYECKHQVQCHTDEAKIGCYNWFSICSKAEQRKHHGIIGKCGHFYCEVIAEKHKRMPCPQNADGHSCKHDCYFLCRPHTHVYKESKQ